MAPITLRSRFLELVEREIGYARAGHPARIVLKINSLVDTQIIEALYEASRAGRRHRPDRPRRLLPAAAVPGVSERIRVRSIIGEFLEHSRIFMFANGGRPEWYIGSADLMERNLDRRVEVVTPVEDHEAQARLARIIEVMLADDRRSWQLQPDGRWLRTEVIESREGTVDTFAVLKEDAAEAAASLLESKRPQVNTGSMDPPGVTAAGERAAPDGGRAQVPHDGRRDRRAADRGRRPRRVRRARAGDDRRDRGPVRRHGRRGACRRRLRGPPPDRRRRGR